VGVRMEHLSLIGLRQNARYVSPPNMTRVDLFDLL
jgi:hypothetical protein